MLLGIGSGFSIILGSAEHFNLGGLSTLPFLLKEEAEKDRGNNGDDNDSDYNYSDQEDLTWIFFIILHDASCV